MVNPLPTRMILPATSDPSTPAVPATRTTKLTDTALAIRTAGRRGMAACVVWIMRVPYSVVTASVARTTTVAWLSQTPVNASFVVSSKHSLGDGHWDVWTDAVAMAPSTTVDTAMARANHPV